MCSFNPGLIEVKICIQKTDNEELQRNLKSCLPAHISMTQERTRPAGSSATVCRYDFCRVYRTGGEAEPANMTQVQRLAPTRRQQAVLCAASLCQPAGHEGSHCEATQWWSCVPVTGKTRRIKGFPSSQGSRDMKWWSCQGPKTSKQNLDMSESSLLVHVSHGITSFDLIQSDTLREYFSLCHPRAI